MEAELDGASTVSVIDGVKRVPVRVRLHEADRDGIRGLRSVNLAHPQERGAWVPLETLGKFELRPEVSTITRLDGERVNRVLGFSRPGSLPIGIAAEVLEQLKSEGFELPPGYRLTVGGDAENQGEALGNLTLYLPLIVVLTIATLVLTFRSVGLAAFLMVVAVLSTGFGLLATWAWGLPLSFNTIIGSLGLMGLAFNSSIVVLASILSSPAAASGEPQAIIEAVMETASHLLPRRFVSCGRLHGKKSLVHPLSRYEIPFRTC